jgi:hypothetical protein
MSDISGSEGANFGEAVTSAAPEGSEPAADPPPAAGDDPTAKAVDLLGRLNMAATNHTVSVVVDWLGEQ